MKYWILATLAFGLFLTGCSRKQSSVPPVNVESPSASMSPEGTSMPQIPTQQIKPSTEELSH